jgi:hypothetical protein
MVTSVTAILKRFKTDWATQLQPEAMMALQRVLTT